MAEEQFGIQDMSHPALNFSGIRRDGMGCVLKVMLNQRLITPDLVRRVFFNGFVNQGNEVIEYSFSDISEHTTKIYPLIALGLTKGVRVDGDNNSRTIDYFGAYVPFNERGSFGMGPLGGEDHIRKIIEGRLTEEDLRVLGAEVMVLAMEKELRRSDCSACCFSEKGGVPMNLKGFVGKEYKLDVLSPIIGYVVEHFPAKK